MPAVSLDPDSIRRHWAGNLAVLCLGILCQGLIYSPQPVEDFTRLVFAQLFLAVPLWALFYFAFLRARQAPAEVGLTCFASLYATLLLVGCTAPLLRGEASEPPVQTTEQAQERSTQQAQQGGPADRTSSVQLQVLPGGVLPNIDPPAVDQPVALAGQGANPELRREIQQRLDAFNRLEDDYRLELDALGWNSALQGERLLKVGALAQSRRMAAKAKKLIADQRRQALSLFTRHVAEAGGKYGDSAERKEYLANLTAASQHFLRRNLEVAGMEGEHIARMSELFKLLAENKRWSVAGEQLHFEDAAVRERFDALLAQSKELRSTQTELQQLNQEETDRRLAVLAEGGGRADFLCAVERLGGNPAPKYPVQARLRGEQGRVVLSAFVSADGYPELLRVRESSGFPDLDKAALEAVSQWCFTPEKKQSTGEPIETRLLIPIAFKLDDEESSRRMLRQ